MISRDPIPWKIDFVGISNFSLGFRQREKLEIRISSSHELSYFPLFMGFRMKFSVFYFRVFRYFVISSLFSNRALCRCRASSELECPKTTAMRWKPWASPRSVERRERRKTKTVDICVFDVLCVIFL